MNEFAKACVIIVKFHKAIRVQETELKYELSEINTELTRNVPSGGYLLEFLWCI
jgi:hypothetical protein